MEEFVGVSGLIRITVAKLNVCRMRVELSWWGICLDSLDQRSVLVELRGLCERKVVNVLLVFELHL